MFWNYAFSMDTGAVVNYWQLVSLYVSIGNGQAIAKARGFLSQEAFEAGKRIIIRRCSNACAVGSVSTISNRITTRGHDGKGKKRVKAKS